MDRFPRSFYFKLLTLILIALGVFWTHQDFIQAGLADDNLSVGQLAVSLIKEVVGIDNQGHPSQPSSKEQLDQEPDNSSPRQFDQELISSDHYQIAQDRATSFNAGLDLVGLNESFINLVNQRPDLTQPLHVASHLASAAQARIYDLSTWHYLGSLDPWGNEFRVYYNEIEDAQYRIGENLYELYISAYDVHLDTWQNEEIFAEYLYSVFEQTLAQEALNDYSSLYISARIEASDYLIEATPYVRLVASLTLDLGQ